MSVGRSGKDDTYDYWSEDDNVLAVVHRDSGLDASTAPYYVAANVLQVVVLPRKPAKAGEPSAQEWHSAEPHRSAVPIDFEPDRVFLLLRVYTPCNSKGEAMPSVLVHTAAPYYQLQEYMQDRPEKWCSRSVLGHISLERVRKVQGHYVERMYKEKDKTWRRELIKQYEKEHNIVHPKEEAKSRKRPLQVVKRPPGTPARNCSPDIEATQPSAV